MIWFQVTRYGREVNLVPWDALVNLLRWRGWSHRGGYSRSIRRDHSINLCAHEGVRFGFVVGCWCVCFGGLLPCTLINPTENPGSGPYSGAQSVDFRLLLAAFGKAGGGAGVQGDVAGKQAKGFFHGLTLFVGERVVWYLPTVGLNYTQQRPFGRGELAQALKDCFECDRLVLTFANLGF